MSTYTKEESALQRADTSHFLNIFGGSLKNRLEEEEQQLLEPFIPRLLGSRTTAEIELRRAYAVISAVLRKIVPMSLDAVKRADLAERLRAIEPVVDIHTAHGADQILFLVCVWIRKYCEDDRNNEAAVAVLYACDHIYGALSSVIRADSVSTAVVTSSGSDVATAFAAGAGGYFITEGAFAAAGGSLASLAAADIATAASTAAAAVDYAAHACVAAIADTGSLEKSTMITARRPVIETALHVYEEAFTIAPPC
jgi:hypothetical protein